MVHHPLIHLDETNVKVHVELEKKRRRHRCFHSQFQTASVSLCVKRPSNPFFFYLFVTVVEDENDGSGEEDGHEADTETEDPVVCDADVEVEGGEDGTPHYHVEHLLEVKEEALSGLNYN